MKKRIILIIAALVILYVVSYEIKIHEKKVGVTIFDGGSDPVTITNNGETYNLDENQEEQILKILKSGCLTDYDGEEDYSNSYLIHFRSGNEGYVLKDKNLIFIECFYSIPEEEYQRLLNLLEEYSE